MSVTHKKIAEAAGVSQSTVSKALSDSMEIPSETAAHIRRIAEQLGYFEEKLNQRRRRAGGYLFPHVAILVPEAEAEKPMLAAMLLAVLCISLFW